MQGATPIPNDVPQVDIARALWIAAKEQLERFKRDGCDPSVITCQGAVVERLHQEYDSARSPEDRFTAAQDRVRSHEQNVAWYTVEWQEHMAAAQACSERLERSKADLASAQEALQVLTAERAAKERAAAMSGPKAATPQIVPAGGLHGALSVLSLAVEAEISKQDPNSFLCLTALAAPIFARIQEASASAQAAQATHTLVAPGAASGEALPHAALPVGTHPTAGQEQDPAARGQNHGTSVLEPAASASQDLKNLLAGDQDGMTDF